MQEFFHLFEENLRKSKCLLEVLLQYNPQETCFVKFFLSLNFLVHIVPMNYILISLEFVWKFYLETLVSEHHVSKKYV